MSRKKKIKKFNTLLDKYCSEKSLIKIYRSVTEGEANIYGIILKRSASFLHLKENDDFNLEGEVIIKMDHFDSIRYNDYDRTSEKILIKENQLNKSKLKRTKIDLNSWKSIFSNLMEKDIHVIVECENLEDPTFTIGPIEKINNKSVEIRYYDPNGKLDKKLTKLKYKHITLIKFNDNYSKTFRKYLKNP